MRGLGKGLAALAVLGGLIPPTALAQTQKPLCRNVVQIDARTTISDVLIYANRIYPTLYRRVTLLPAATSPGREKVAIDAKSPKLVFDIFYRDYRDLSKGVTDVWSFATDFKQAGIHVAAIIDGDPRSWNPSRVDTEYSAMAMQVKTSDETNLFTDEGTQRLMMKGTSLELKMGDFRRLADDNQRENAANQLSRYTPLASYDRQAQAAAFTSGQDRIDTLRRQHELGQCALGQPDDDF